jgi:molybdopterin converting factor small subunit
LKSAIAAIGFLVSLISPVFAQSGDPIQQDLAGVLKALSEQLTRADQLVAQLRDTAKKGPVEAQLEVTKAGTALGQLADRLQDEGDIMSQLRAIKNAAQVHRDRVQALAKGTISEADRIAVLTKWNALLQQADRAQAKVMTMRDKLLGALAGLRERQVGISEELLVGSYEDAVKSLNQWLDELEKLINDLRASIGVSGV